MNHTIKIALPLPDGRTAPKDCNAAELSAAMNAEIDAFNRHLTGLPNQDRLVPAEKTLLKTYLAWKILHAPDAESTKD